MATSTFWPVASVPTFGRAFWFLVTVQLTLEEKVPKVMVALCSR